MRLCETLEAAVDGTEALLLVTRWPEFSRLAQVLDGMADPPVVIDGRRMLDPTADDILAKVARGLVALQAVNQ